MCCTPHTATIVAGVLCVFQSFVNFCWNVPLMIGLSLNNTDILTVTPVDVSELENPFALYGAALVLALSNMHLLIFSCILFAANHKKKTDWIGAWCIVVMLKTIINVLLGVLYIYKYINDHQNRIAYLRLAALFSGIFFFWPVINIVLFMMVVRRYRDASNSPTLSSTVDTLPPPDDNQPPPYSPGTYIPRQNSDVTDPAPITGWINQPLLNFD